MATEKGMKELADSVVVCSGADMTVLNRAGVSVPVQPMKATNSFQPFSFSTSFGIVVGFLAEHSHQEY